MVIVVTNQMLKEHSLTTDDLAIEIYKQSIY